MRRDDDKGADYNDSARVGSIKKCDIILDDYRTDAAQRLGLSTREIKSLVQPYRQQRAIGLVSKQYGKRSNNAISAVVKQ